MNSNTSRTSARRAGAALVAAALAAGPFTLLAAGPAQATGGTGDGRANAVVLKAGLDVGLLDKTVHVPLRATLNEVSAPGRAEKTALTLTLDGVDRGQPFSMVRADVAEAVAEADRKRAEGSATLARATVHLPGLPLLSLVQVEKVTARALCEAGRKPVAEANVLGAVTVLGKKVTLSSSGTTRIVVPAVGEVRLDLSATETTSRKAAATALRLKVSVNPLQLNVAEIEGEVTLVQASCTAPKAAAPTPSPEPSKPVTIDDPKPDVKPQTGGSDGNLAETGGSSATPYVAGGALVLLGIGAGTVLLTRGRSRA
ncbi:SCO1860 family LAETG-anchored protein [Streptomyces sp. NPDC097619]|uniref:SCO1860 family LAETG-anchored protein n=1 Tax=Streptomyces sp. NPDC097619 TaxID=3157228 RepID=UPI00331ABD7C